MKKSPKSPRSLTVADINPAMLRKRYYFVDVMGAYPGSKTLVDITREQADGQIHGILVVINALNDMVPNLRGFDELPYLPGDMVLCKLNIIKMKKPRKNPWYRKA